MLFSSTHESRNSVYTSSNKPTGETDGAGTRKHKIGAISKAMFLEEKKKRNCLRNQK